MGLTWEDTNALEYELSLAAPLRGAEDKLVVSVMIDITRKTPDTETIFPDTYTGCERTGRTLCNICKHWGRVDDDVSCCTNCMCYLLPEDKDLIDIAIANLVPENPQWDKYVPFDPTSQIGGTISATAKIIFERSARDKKHLNLTNDIIVDGPLRDVGNQRNQMRALIAVKLGACPILSTELCRFLRQIVEDTAEGVLLNFLKTLSDFSASDLNKKTIGVMCQFSTDGSELCMTFKLYLPAKPSNLNCIGLPMNRGEQIWACDRGIIAAFLSVDPTQSLHSLRLTPFDRKPVPETADIDTPSKVLEANDDKHEDKVKMEQSSPAPAPIPSELSFSALVSPAVTVTAAGESKRGDNFTTPSDNTSSSSCSASSSATSCEDSLCTGSSTGFVPSTTSSTTSGSGSGSSSSSKSTPMDVEDVSQADTLALEAEGEDAPTFLALKSSANDDRKPGGYDVLDTSLAGLMRAMMVDAMKMSIEFLGYKNDYLFDTHPFYSYTAERYESAYSSISGLMRVRDEKLKCTDVFYYSNPYCSRIE